MPNKMSPDELLSAHRDLWRQAFSVRASFRRIRRSLFTLRWGAVMMCGIMNLFSGLKALTNNEPINFESTDNYRSIREHLNPIVNACLDAESVT